MDYVYMYFSVLLLYFLLRCLLSIDIGELSITKNNTALIF